MSRVEIRHEQLAAVIGGLSGLADRIEQNRQSAVSATPARLDVPAGLQVSRLGPVVEWIRDQLPMLEDLVEIARILDEDDTGMVAFNLVDGQTSLDYLCAKLGETLANQAHDLDTLELEDLEEFTDGFEAWVDNDAVMASFFQFLGPEGTLVFANNLAQESRDIYNTEGTNEQLEAVKQRMLDNLKQGLALATHHPTGPGQAFGQAMAEAAILDIDDLFEHDLPYNSSGALAFLLYDGDFGDEFLSAVAGPLDEHERVSMSGEPGMWGERWNFGADFARFMPGTSGARDEVNLDPLTSLMSAFGHAPDAATAFFRDPERIDYYFNDRIWSNDEYGAISHAVAGMSDRSGLSTADQETTWQVVGAYADGVSTREDFNASGASAASDHVARILASEMEGFIASFNYSGSAFDSSGPSERFLMPPFDQSRGLVFEPNALLNLFAVASASDGGHTAMQSAFADLQERRFDAHSVGDDTTLNEITTNTVQFHTLLGKGSYIDMLRVAREADSQGEQIRDVTDFSTDVGIDSIGAVVSGRAGPVMGSATTLMLGELRDGLSDAVLGAPGEQEDAVREQLRSGVTDSGELLTFAATYDAYGQLVEAGYIAGDDIVEGTVDARGNVREIDTAITSIHNDSDGKPRDQVSEQLFRDIAGQVREPTGLNTATVDAFDGNWDLQILELNEGQDSGSGLSLSDFFR